MFITVKAKKAITVFIVILAFLLCLVGVGYTDAQTLYLNKVKRELPIYSVERSDNLIAISFDAAWGADKTRAIMDICDAYSVEATFFLVGFWVDKYPEMVKEIYERGYLIGNHSTNHLHMSKLSTEEITKELTITNDKIEAITGVKPTFFRPPFGEYNDKIILTARSLDMQTIQWNVDSLDWKGLSGGEIANRIVSRTTGGSIILCHNNSDHILDALPILILGLKNKGYTFVTMDKVVLTGPTYIDNKGVQHAEIKS